MVSDTGILVDNEVISKLHKNDESILMEIILFWNS